MWLYGAGFPKSHDISKGIDKAAGAEREVTGTRTSAYGREDHSSKGKRGRARLMSGDKREVELKNKPATDEAEQWDGYGTALKPAWEPVYLCRAPRQDKTFANLATEFGSGALNIDGGRIGTSGEEPNFRGDRGLGRSAGGFYGDGSTLGKRDEDKIEEYHQHQGRWPANLILSHHPDCVKVGEFEVEGRVINRWKDGMKPFGGGAGGEYETVRPSREGEASAERTYESEGGTDFAMKPGARRDNTELVERWACVPECPARQLDDQAGELTSGFMKAGQKRKASKGLGGYQDGFPDEAINKDSYADRGGPSRFFYCGKTSRREKDKGLENFYWKRVDAGFELVSQEEWEKLDKKKRARGCIHPTVKPLAVLRYLSTLMLPPPLEGAKRRLLVPFLGSGSEIIAARQAGWDEVVGIEMDGQYIKIADARIAANLGMF
jgi:hypothetical protein